MGSKDNINIKAEGTQMFFFYFFFLQDATVQFCRSNLKFTVVSGSRPTEVGPGKRHFDFGSSVKITSCSIFTDCVVFKTKLAERSSIVCSCWKMPFLLNDLFL